MKKLRQHTDLDGFMFWYVAFHFFLVARLQKRLRICTLDYLITCTWLLEANRLEDCFKRCLQQSFHWPAGSEESLLNVGHGACELLELVLHVSSARLVLAQQYSHLLLHLQHLFRERVGGATLITQGDIMLKIKNNTACAKWEQT